MADETVVEETKDEPAKAADETPVETGPSLEEQLAEERLARARAEGELAALRRQPSPRVEEPKPAPRVTRENVQAAYDKGEITDAQRIEYLADIRYEERRAAERAGEAQQRQQQARVRASNEIGDYITKYPDLGVRGSELIAKVQVERDRIVADEGADPDDPRVQLRAVKAIVGGHHLGGGNGVDNRDLTRRRTPTGSAGTPADGDTRPGATKKSKGETLLDSLKPEWQAFFLHQAGEDRARAIKTLEHADEETTDRMRVMGRFK